MKRRGKVMRALSGAVLILLLSFTSTGLANTELGILFVGNFSAGLVKAFNLDTNAAHPFTSPSLPGVEDIACGPDGRVYAALSGAAGPRKIISFKQDGSIVITVLDFDLLGALHPLKTSGGPEGLSFEVLVQDDGRAVPSGRLTFNTRHLPGDEETPAKPHTGVWVIDTDGTPRRIVSPIATDGTPFGEGTVYLTKGPFQRHLLAVERTGGRVVRRGPLPTPPTPADEAAGVNFLNPPALPQNPIGITVDSNGDIFVSHTGSNDITRWFPTGPNTPKSAPGAPYQGFYAHIPLGPIVFIEFDVKNNLYVSNVTAAGKVWKVTPSPIEATELLGFTVPFGVGVAVCPRRTAALIDIKPGSFPNPINVKSNGVIPVAILGTAGFDPTTIDQATANIKFGRKAVVAGGGGASPDRLCKPEDVNGDGKLDLLCHFRQKLTGFQLRDTTGVIRWGNQDFEGEAGIITGTTGD